METNKDDEYTLKYEKEDIDDMIHAILKKHPNGLSETELLEKMPKDLNKKVIKGFLLLLVNSGEIIPETAFRINNGETSDSQFTGFINDRIAELQNEVFNNFEQSSKTITGNMG